jgi:hypothetical protein
VVIKNVSPRVLQVGMRSRNQGGESSSNGHVSCPKPSIISSDGGKGPSEDAKKNKANRKGEDDVMASGTVKRHLKPSGESEKKTKKPLELSKEDLIQLLSIMEGELQVESVPVLPVPNLERKEYQPVPRWTESTTGEGGLPSSVMSKA